MFTTTPGRLAKELGVGRFEMFQVMQELKIHAKRMDALLSESQQQVLRTFFANKAKAQERRRDEYRRSVLDARRVAVRPAVREFPKSCVCCERRWIYRAEEDKATRLCPRCTGHYPQEDETAARRLACAESHVDLYKEDREVAREQYAQARQLRSVAYESRAKWRAALAEVVLDHYEGPDGMCWCGETIPCRTWRKLDESNRGIHRQVEKWSSWSERRLDDFLYGEGRAAHLVIDEDEPAGHADDDDHEGIAY